jgi:hypothetical protein
LLVDHLSLYLEHSTLDIPALRPQTYSVWQKIWWAIVDSRIKIKWMVFTVFVPEYIIGKALNEMVAVNKRGRERYVFRRDDKVNWETVHNYMANMGYFVVDFGGYWLEASSGDAVRTVEEELNQHVQLAESSEFIERNLHMSVAASGYLLEKMVAETLQLEPLSASTRLNLSRLTHPYWALASEQLGLLVPGFVDLPTVPVREMEILNHGDTLVKILALVQVSHLIVQLVARKVAGLPSAQLEIGALAFSTSSIFTYFLYWNRPQGVESIHIMKAKCAPSRARILEVAKIGPHFMWTNLRSEYKFERIYDVVPIPNYGLQYIHHLPVWWQIRKFLGFNTEIAILAFGAFLGGTLFGGLHCFAWNFHFPTRGEALAWRVCSILTSVLPLLAVVPLAIWTRWHPWGDPPKKSPAVRFALGLIAVFGFLIPYVLARLFLIIEMFRSLFFLPPEAFIDTWSGSFPHWG